MSMCLIYTIYAVDLYISYMSIITLPGTQLPNWMPSKQVNPRHIEIH